MIKKYQNGNVTVSIDLTDGTKIRETQDDEFRPAFAECCDVHISDRCDNKCEFCYAGCTPYGKWGNLTDWAFLETLHPYTEMAINLQAPLPLDIIDFLCFMKEKRVIVNVTVNQNHFMQETFRKLIWKLQHEGLIFGVGISMTKPTKEFIMYVQQTPNAVVHVINGIVATEQLREMAYHGLKLLILGYKDIGRGSSYIADPEVKKQVRNRKGFLYWNIKFILEEHWFKVVSFDNLALDQLNVKRFLSDEEWNEFYMGDDGSHTFFINLVDGTFGKNSLMTKEKRFPIGKLTIDEMFQKIKDDD